MFENTKRLAVIVLIAILIAAAGYGYWRYTNRGTVIIEVTTPPAAIAIDGADSGICDKVACTITLVVGEHFIGITQENHMPYEARIQLKRGETRRIKATLEEVGQFSEGDTKAGATAIVKKIPPHPAHDIPFIIRTDEKRSLTSLVKKDNDAIIAYFPRPFVNPRLVANDANTIVWIIDGRPEQNGIYEVNVAAASRTSRFITTEPIESMLASPDGTKLLVTTREPKAKSYIIDKATGDVPVPLKVNINPQLAAWRTDATLFAAVSDDKQTKLLQLAVAGAPQEKILKIWDTPHNVIDILWDAKAKKLWIQSKTGVATVEY